MRRSKKVLLISVSLISIFAIILNLIPEMPLSSNIKIDRILVEKGKRRMHIFSNDSIIKTYKIVLGRNPIGSKEFEGDGKTPEGVYSIDSKNPESSFHLNLGISYPNKEDQKHAQQIGKSPGGQIKIHGLRNGLGIIGKFHRFFDWTEGCIALTNKEIEELYKYVPIGTVVEIKK